MNRSGLKEDKAHGTLSVTAARCIFCVEVSLSSFFTAAEVELLAAGLRYTLLEVTLVCVWAYFQLRRTLRHLPRLVGDPRGYEISSVILLLATTTAMTGCSVRKFAINKLGDSLANSGTTFASDNDPEFVGEAIPFSLKLIEGLLAESPKHRGLLIAAASGFTQYSYGWVQEPADETEETDLDKANEMHMRARKLYLRAKEYGMRGLEAKHRNFAARLKENPAEALRGMKQADVPLLYWTALPWGAAIALSKDHPELVAQQPQI